MFHVSRCNYERDRERAAGLILRTQACYYTAEDPTVCDVPLPASCTYPAYEYGGYTGSNSQCTLPEPDSSGCRRDYDTPSNGYNPQRYAKCGSSCCRAKSGDNACYYSAENSAVCDSLPSTCTYDSYTSGGFSGSNAECTAKN